MTPPPHARKPKEANGQEHSADEKYRTLVESIPAITYTSSLAQPGQMLFVSPQIDALGYAPEEWTAEPDCFLHCVHDDDRQRLISKIKECQSNGKILNIDYRLKTKDGKVRWINDQARVVTEDEETNLQGVMQDITERKSKEDGLGGLDESTKRAAQVFEGSHDAIVITDTEGTVVAVNKAFSELNGFSAEEVIGQKLRMLHSGRHGADFYDAMWERLLATGRWSGEVWNKRKNGIVYPEWLSITAVKDDSGHTAQYVGISSDISERKKFEDKIYNLAHFDPLTSLPNRSLLTDRLTDCIDTTQPGECIGILFLDLDRFKNVNDSLGHELGDQLLVAITRRLQLCVRFQDTVSRWGGDEFVVVLPGADKEQALRVSERILSVLSQSFRVGSHDICVTASVGMTVFPEDGADAQTLVKNADAAMYYAKDSGRNQCQFFNQSLMENATERMIIGTGLRKALTNNEFLLHYQPQYDTTGKIIGAEALIRWKHPQLGMVPPGKFIQIAEDSGLIVPIGEWVMAEACRQNAEWQKQAAVHVPVSVNLSVHQFKQQRLLETTLAALETAGLKPDLLELEITESVLMHQEAESIEKLHSLRECGVSLALDDFGTGYSSLNYLCRLPLQRLKIDKSFVHDMCSTINAATIVKSIISLAHSLGMRVLAEGVETEEQHQFLNDHGCDEYQGFLFSKPLPAAEFGKMLG